MGAQAKVDEPTNIESWQLRVVGNAWLVIDNKGGIGKRKDSCRRTHQHMMLQCHALLLAKVAEFGQQLDRILLGFGSHLLNKDAQNRRVHKAVRERLPPRRICGRRALCGNNLPI